MMSDKDNDNEIMEFDDSVDELEEQETLPSENEDGATLTEEPDFSKEESAQDKKNSSESKLDSQNKQNPLIKKALIGVGVLVVLGGSYAGYLMFAPGGNNLDLAPSTFSSEVPAGLTLVEDSSATSAQTGVKVNVSPDVNSVLNSINKPQNSVSRESSAVNEEYSLPKPKALVEPDHSEEVLLGQSIADQIEELTVVTKAIQDEISSRFNHLNNTITQKDQGASQQGRLQELLINLQKDYQALLKKSEAQKELILKLNAVTKEAYEKLIEYKKVNSILKNRLKAKKRKAFKKKEKVVDKTKTIGLSGDWKVSGANNQMVVLSHKSGTTVIKKIGELIEGHKILKINVQKGLIQTSNGIILIP